MDIFKAYERHLVLNRKSPSTIYQYLTDIKLFCKAVDPFVCTVHHIESFFESLIKKGYENSSLQRKLAAIKSFFHFLLDEEEISKLPFVNLPKFKVAYKEQRILTLDEVGSIFAVLSGLPMTLKTKELDCIFRIFYFLGLRVAEAVSLDIRNVRADDISFTGKGNKTRILPLVNPGLTTSLSEWVEFRKRFYGEALFINTTVKDRISVRTVQRWIKELGEMAEIEGCISPHMMRRTFATHLLDKGADIFSVSDLLGHSSLSTTKRYARVSVKKRKETLLLL